MSKEILDLLKTEYNYLIELGYDVFGVFLYGSQNYKVAGPNSDIDLKAICFLSEDSILPQFERSGENEGITTLCPITSFVKYLQTGYHTWYELLFTDYFIINPKYKKVWTEVLKKRESLVRENLENHLLAEDKYLQEQLIEMGNEWPPNRSYENKRLVYFYRIYYLVSKLLEGQPYKDCLIFNKEQQKEALRLKTFCPFTYEECKFIARNLYEKTQSQIKEFLQEKDFPDNNDSYEQIAQLLLSLEV